MDNNIVILGFWWYAVFVFSLTFHEAAHGFAAMKLGDETASAVDWSASTVCAYEKVAFRNDCPADSVVFLQRLDDWLGKHALRPILGAAEPQTGNADGRCRPAANLLLVIVAALIIRLGISMGYFYPPESITFSKVTAATMADWQTA